MGMNFSKIAQILCPTAFPENLVNMSDLTVNVVTINIELTIIQLLYRLANSESDGQQLSERE